MTTILLVIASIIIESTLSLTECTDFQQCQLQSINDNGVFCSGSYSCDHFGGDSSLSIESTASINCNGWRGCNAANRIAKRAIYCNGGYSCYGGSFDARILMCDGSQSCTHNDDSIIAKSLAFCGGYSSCVSATMLQARKILYCSGEYSCKSSTVTIGEDMYCDGEQACLSTTINPLNDVDPVNSVTCSGKNACSGANINKVNTLRAYGEYALFLANIHSVSLIEAYGYKALYGATIESGSLATMNVEAFGFYAGESATIVCSSGSTCNLVCKNTGCSRLTFQCHPGSTCNITPDGCKSDNSVKSVDGIVCPTVSFRRNEIILSDEDKKEDHEENDDEDMDKMDDINLSGDVTVCNSANECEGQVISSPDLDIECNGYQSCLDGKMYDQDVIDCNGEEACFGAEMDPVRQVFCGGYKGCSDMDYALPSDGYITCTGKQSCENIMAKPSSSPQEVRCLGASSCREMDIESGDYDELQCYGFQACHSMKFNTTTMAECLGAYSCAESEITSSEGVFNYLECGGSASCANATIDIVHGINAKGYMAARDGILSARAIYGSGYYGLAYATIDSKGRETVFVHSNGHLSGYGATFICQSGSACTLQCSGSGCNNMNYVCLRRSTCNVVPRQCKTGDISSYDGNDCPNMLTTIPPIKDYANDEIYQYQEWEIQQDYLLSELLDNYADADIVEDLIFNAKVKREEIELFGDIKVSMKQGSIFKYEAKELFEIGSVLLIIGALVYLWNKMKSEKSEYLPLSP